jgi:two-component system, OmpR family, sensor kinase
MTLPQSSHHDSFDSLRKQIEQLSHAVDARDTFIAVAAHELRNPMMPIIGQIELLLSAIRAGKCSLDIADERLGKIQRTIQRYMKRAVVLLDVSRLNSGSFRLQPVSCDLTLLLQEIAEQFAAVADYSGVKLSVHCPQCVLGLWDRMAVEQIIDNLLSNAIKYGGRGPVELSLTADERSVEIKVRDHGKGIMPADRARVFERFERAVGHNEYRSGFGIGLWVVGQLIQAMKGSISIEDPPGGGALFKVSLPRPAEVLT